MSRAIEHESPPPVRHASREASATPGATATQRERTGLATAENPPPLASVFRYVTEYRGEFFSTLNDLRDRYRERCTGSPRPCVTQTKGRQRQQERHPPASICPSIPLFD